jgi:hypothetical protein
MHYRYVDATFALWPTGEWHMHLEKFFIDEKKPGHVTCGQSSSTSPKEALLQAIAALGNRADAVRNLFGRTRAAISRPVRSFDSHLTHLAVGYPAWFSVAPEHRRESKRTRMKATETSDAETFKGSPPSASKRVLLKSAWVAPVVIAVTLPRSGYAANISGTRDRPKESGDAKPKSNNGNHFGQFKKTS